jgi:hypothetical protein
VSDSSIAWQVSSHALFSKHNMYIHACTIYLYICIICVYINMVHMCIYI